MKKQMLFKLCISVGLISLMSCSQSNSPKSSDQAIARNIIGGTEADSSFQKENGVVLIVTFSEDPPLLPGDEPTRNVSICTGTLISKDVVLTALHCFLTPNITNVLVGFVTKMADATQAEIIPAINLAVNQEFNGFSAGLPGNDIALLKLASTAPADFKVAKLPNKDSKLTVKGDTLMLAGYGGDIAIVNKLVTDPITGQESVVRIPNTQGEKLLRYVDVKVTAVSSELKEITIDQEGGKKGACHGDSGGPAFLKQADGSNLLVGVTSRATNQIGNCDQQAIYTDVAAQLDWITKSMVGF